MVVLRGFSSMLHHNREEPQPKEPIGIFMGPKEQMVLKVIKAIKETQDPKGTKAIPHQL
jgi:hypothetical protein